jgi:cardiolipin synthase
LQFRPLEPAPQELAQCFEQDFSQSAEVDLRQWQARSWRKRLLQYLCGGLYRLLVKLLDRLR